MRQTKHQYYVDGVDSNRASITIDLKRMDAAKISKWSPKKKKEAMKWLEKYAAPASELFIKNLRELLTDSYNSPKL